MKPDLPHHSAVLFLMAIFFFSCSKEHACITIHIDASTIEGIVTPWLYGACIEDVNHEIYGGLYGQMIFGESFEEPVCSPEFSGFTRYDGVWTLYDNELSVGSYPGAKLVYDFVEMSDGIVEADIKFDGGSSHGNAGLLVKVSSAGKGADNFYGYEISLSADGSKVVVGKHKNNFEHIRDIPVTCDPAAWNKLKVMIECEKIGVLLNGASVFEMEVNDEELSGGNIALRTWNSDVRFRNVRAGDRTLEFITESFPVVSSQWNAIVGADTDAEFALDEKDRFNGQQCQTIELVEGAAGISNSGLNGWGIAVRKGQMFEGRLYLKGRAMSGPVTVALQNAEGTKDYASFRINDIATDWTKYVFDLTSDTDDANARFAVFFHSPGKLWIDQVTLMGTGSDRFKGLPMRNDIGQAMVDQGLTFLRYGGTMINVPEYRFKNMIGNPDRRPPYTGHWYRYSTNGFGIEEFLQFCEAAGFTASFAVNIEERPQDMGDMIEYLNGPVESEWGAMRAANGHPQPYNVKYISIGNEEVLFDGDREDQYNHYIERFNLLYDAIKSKDPSVSFINAAWWRADSPNIEKVFRALDGKADYWDYHPWADQLTSGKDVERELRQMQQMFTGWNPNTTMKVAIFEENGNTHNMQRALGHVTLQNAVRRMGDFVLTSCAANALQPYGQNDNGWDQGQVFFTPSQVWGMPPYYAQQMASVNHLPLLVQAVVDPSSEELDITATRSEDGGRLVLHIANTGAGIIKLDLDIEGFGNIREAKSITLSGNLDDINTPEQPERIIPVTNYIKKLPRQTCRIEPYSYTIVSFSEEKPVL